MSDRTETVKPEDVSRLVERAALLQEAAAESLGLNATDLRCLALAAAEPGITASRLAELSGLTTGAITGVLDRLERERLVERQADPSDRRRILVRVLPDRAHEVDAVYEPVNEQIATVLSDFDEHQLQGIGDFVARASEILEGQIARLRARTRGGLVGEMFTAPLGDAMTGRLVFKSGAPRISLRAAPLGPAAEARLVAELAHSTLRLGGEVMPDELCRATFEGPVPDVRARHGIVAVAYRKRLDWRQRSAQVALTREVPWSIEIQGGLSALAADLRGLRLRSFEVKGGVDRLDLALPDPDGTSRILISGGANTVSLKHLAQSAVRLSLSGGAQTIRFGGDRLRHVSAGIRLETTGAASAANRYEIEISGGVRSLSVTEG
jgi:DNA-binding MarR family transcriptional regulator